MQILSFYFTSSFVCLFFYVICHSTHFSKFSVFLFTYITQETRFFHPVYNFSQFLNIVSNSLIITSSHSTPGRPSFPAFLFWSRQNAAWPGAQLSSWGSSPMVFCVIFLFPWSYAFFSLGFNLLCCGTSFSNILRKDPWRQIFCDCVWQYLYFVLTLVW